MALFTFQNAQMSRDAIVYELEADDEDKDQTPMKEIAVQVAKGEFLLVGINALFLTDKPRRHKNDNAQSIQLPEATYQQFLKAAQAQRDQIQILENLKRMALKAQAEHVAAKKALYPLLQEWLDPLPPCNPGNACSS